MSARFTIGLDYGTNSLRALIVNVANGKEIASAVWGYEHGTQGVILSRDPNLARQHPADYVPDRISCGNFCLNMSSGIGSQVINASGFSDSAVQARSTIGPISARSSSDRTIASSFSRRARSLGSIA